MNLAAIKERIEWRRTMGGRSPGVHETLLAMESDIDALVAEVEALREAMGVLETAAEEFMHDAAYTVVESREEDLLAALHDAGELLDAGDSEGHARS